MKGLIFAVLVLVTATPLFPAERDQGPDTPFYSNEDLKKYQYPSERRQRASEPAPPQDNAEVKKVKKITEEVRPTPKRYEVPYKAHEGAARRIIIPVRFNGSVRAPMLLDTGATGLHISVSLAERLGLFGKDEGNLLESTSGIGGTVPAVLTIINKIEVDQLEEQFVPTKVSGSFSKEFEGLVGMDFMANFSIQINTRKHVVVFEEYPTSQQMPGGHDEEWWRANFRMFSAKREEWAKFKGDSYDLGDASKPAATVRTGNGIRILTVGELREFAERQYREADRLMKRLEGYAIDHVVPMEWREY